MLKSLFLILVIFIGYNSFSCTCVGPLKITKSDYNEAGAIFVGKATGVEIFKEGLNSYKIITFEVLEHLKTDDTTKEIIIFTSILGAMCGLDVKVGEKWYIFAHFIDGKLYASLCDRNLNLSNEFKVRDYGIKYSYLSKKIQRKKTNRYKREVRFIKRIRKKQ